MNRSTSTVLLIFALLLSFVLGCSEEKGDAASKFAAARAKVHRAEFSQAIRELKTFLQDHPGHDLGSRAHFLIAKSEMGRNDFDEAAAWFTKTASQFPSSDEAHKAKFKLAMLSLLRGERQRALEQLRKMTDSNGSYAPEISAWMLHLESQEAGQP